MPSFVLNDESKTNSHGFRVKNSGIDLTRFKANPVLLDYHMPSNATVIGKWENIRIEGSLLLADPVFDEEDENAKKIKGKVDRGYIKGASLGLALANAQWELVDDVPTLTLCEVTEASIVPIPSNANALKLYAASGEVMEADEIKLSIESISNQIKQINNMKQIQLSVATLLVLGLQADQLKDNATLEAAIEKLAKDFQEKGASLTAMTAERDALSTKLAAIDTQKATELVDNAIKAGKITADKRESFLSLANSNFEMCKGVLDGIPAKQNLGANIQNAGTPGAFDNVKTMDDFEKLSFEQKLQFKNEAPEQYKSIFSI
jgi:hypothetical protein